MTKKQELAINKKLAAIEKIKDQIAAKRDKLIEQVEDLEVLIEDINEAELMIDEGLRNLQDGIDCISRMI